MKLKFSYYYHIVYIVSYLFIGGCTSGPKNHFPVNPELAQQILSSEVILISPPNKINSEINRSQAVSQTRKAGGGLLPVLIASAIGSSIDRNSIEKSESLIKPVKDQLIDFDLSFKMKKIFGSRLYSINWFNIKKVNVVYDNKNILPHEGLFSKSSNAVIVIRTLASLTPKFSTMIMESTISIYLKSPTTDHPSSIKKEKYSPKLIYKNTVATAYTLPGEITDEENAANEWVKDEGKQIKLAMNKGIKDITDLIVVALNNPFSEVL